MSGGRWARERPPNGDVAAYAEEAVGCPDCGADPGSPCLRDGGLGRGRAVHAGRFKFAAIELRMAWKAAQAADRDKAAREQR